SLCNNTSNSFDLNNASVKTGKLTLTGVITRGKGGANIIPPMKFTYDLTGTDQITQTGVSLSPTSFSTTNSNFQVGDMIMQSTTPSNVYCGVITAKAPGATTVYTLANGNYTGGTISATVFTTKNPPYNMNAYDIWGMYKSDFNTTQIT